MVLAAGGLTTTLFQIKLIMWMCRSISMRPQVLTTSESKRVQDILFEILFSQLANTNCLHCIECFDTLFNASFIIQGHWQSSPMWRQKTWIALYTRSLSCIKQEPQEWGAYIGSLFCICRLIQVVDLKVLFVSTPDLIPLAVKALAHRTPERTSINVNDVQTILQRQALESIVKISTIDSASIAPYVSTILPIILTFCCESPASSDRLKGLECILQLSKLPYSFLFPLQRFVVRRLNKVIDDPKRRVRQLASKARNAWLTIK